MAKGGACMAKGGGHARKGRGHAWQKGGGMHGRRGGHCSGRYPSYWNAFLYLVEFIYLDEDYERTRMNLCMLLSLPLIATIGKA